jgi:hypothetical protein
MEAKCGMSKFSDELEQEIITRYLSGESTVVLGRAYGTSKTAINRVLARHQVQPRKSEERPLRSDAKLYQSDPEILRKMVEDGMSLREIGRALGMASSGVHNACVSFGIARKDRKQQIVAKNCRQIPDSLFSTPLSPTDSWLLGLLMTDGCANEKEHFIKLSISDKDGAQLASQIIGFGNIREILPETREYSGEKIQGKLSLWSYTACSIQLVGRLGALGLTPRKTKTLAFPNISDIALPDFIRGLWDGDGSWYKNDNALIAHFGCASESFIHTLQAITSGITESSAQVRSNHRKDFWQLSYGQKRAVTLARWLYYEPDLPCLERKRAIVQPFL